MASSSSSSSSSTFPDIWEWIQKLPPISHIGSPPISITLISLPSSSLKFSLSEKLTPKSSSSSSVLSFSIKADYKHPILLWECLSLPVAANSKYLTLAQDEDTLSNLLTNCIKDILTFCPYKYTTKLPKLYPVNKFKHIFNLSFLTLTFLLSIYKAPALLRCHCLNTIVKELTLPRMLDAKKLLVGLLGSSCEQTWSSSMNLAITNWFVELGARPDVIITLLPLFSYAVSRDGLWKVKLNCPTVPMDVPKSSNSLPDEKLQFSLQFHQLEGTILLNYKVIVCEGWIEMKVTTDNIRFDVIRLVNETVMNKRGAGTAEKHFPSRVLLQLTPIDQTDVTSISVGKSSGNQTTAEIVYDEGSLDPRNPFSGLGVAAGAGETMTANLKPWKYEQSVHDKSAKLNWLLHDSESGREVFLSKPSRISLIQRKAWFKHRHTSAYRPFTRQGGVIFTNDEYAETVSWKLNKAAMGKTMEMEIRGWVWLTYWPNQLRTTYSETRKLEFQQVVSCLILEKKPQVGTST